MSESSQARGSRSTENSGFREGALRFQPSLLKGWNFGEFNGEVADPEVAEQWLQECEYKFLQMGLGEGLKVQAMTFLFKGHALNWWKSMPQSRVVPPEMGLDEFVEVFRDQFCPDLWREEKAKEFMSLDQGEKSVLAYYIEFTSLSKWYDEWTNREKKLISKFMNGLRAEIQEGVTTADMGSLVAVKAAALQRERLENKKKEEKKRKASAQPSPSVTHSHSAKRAQASHSGFRGAQSTP